MIWAPSEAEKRAEKLMLELKDTAEACGVQTSTALYPMYHARVFDLISKALDQALSDGAEQDALDKVVGANGNGSIHEPHTIWPADGKTGQTLAPDGWRDMPTRQVAIDMGYDPDKPIIVQMEAEAEHIGNYIAKAQEDAPKKKRGRPKGSKAKKAKPAKAKKDKAEAVEETHEEAHAAVIEAVTSSEAQPAGEVAP